MLKIINKIKKVWLKIFGVEIGIETHPINTPEKNVDLLVQKMQKEVFEKNRKNHFDPRNSNK